MVVVNFLDKLIELFLFHDLFGLSLVFSATLNWFATVLNSACISDLITPHLSIIHKCCLTSKFVFF